MPQLSLNKFTERLFAGAAQQRTPFTGSIEVTERCNLQCVHCFINQPAGSPAAPAEEVTRDDFFRIIDEIAQAGCFFLLLTGGEPFMRRDFLQIYQHARSKAMLVSIFTNGTLINKNIAEYLGEWRPFNVEITVYGYTQKTYERITKVPGSYERCMQGIQLLIDHKIPLQLKTSINQWNKHEIPRLRAFAQALGLKYRAEGLLNPRFDRKEGPERVRLSPAEIVELDEQNPDYMAELEEFCAHFSGFEQDTDHIYQCGAGKRVFHIDSHGRLSTCILARAHTFDLLQNNFHKGWNEFLPKVISKTWSEDSRCRGCRLYALCGQCPPLAELTSGDPEQPVPFLCELAHLRAERLNLI